MNPLAVLVSVTGPESACWVATPWTAKLRDKEPLAVWEKRT
jgi:hypothetical protein